MVIPRIFLSAKCTTQRYNMAFQNSFLYFPYPCYFIYNTMPNRITRPWGISTRIGCDNQYLKIQQPSNIHDIILLSVIIVPEIFW